MYRHKPHLARLFYGFDRENLFLRIDFSVVPRRAAVRIHVVSPQEYLVDAPVTGDTFGVYSRASDGEERKKAELKDITCRSILELKVPFGLLDAGRSQRMRFFITIHEDKLEIERHPVAGVLSFSIPDEKFERIMWHV
jgi:hypothetical protein